MNKLSICKVDIENKKYGVLGMTELLSCLAESNQFEVFYHADRIPVVMGPCASLIYYNDKKIYLDFWDNEAPTYTDTVFNYDLDLIIKLQHMKMSFEYFEEVCSTKNLFISSTKEQRLKFFNKIVPWTFFSSKMMRQFKDKEHNIQNASVDKLAFFCGKWRRSRKSIRKKMIEYGIEYIDSDQAEKKVISDEEYLYKMKSSKFGLSLHGRGSQLTEAKNRREIDYMMLKKPLLLNYKPYYYNPMIEGKHYIYINENTNFAELENMYNIQEIASNGYQWYKENASPEGVVKTFLQIINDKLKGETK